MTLFLVKLFKLKNMPEGLKHLFEFPKSKDFGSVYRNFNIKRINSIKSGLYYSLKIAFLAIK